MTTEDWDKIEATVKKTPEAAIKMLIKVFEIPSETDQGLKSREKALLKLSEVYRDLKKGSDLAALVSSAKPFLLLLQKAKTNKILRSLVDLFSDIPGSLNLQVSVCKDAIEWAKAQNRTFLRQSLETRLCAFYLDAKMYSESLALIANLLKELKRLDDKNVLVEVQLLESRVFHALNNLSKSRASLTSARTSANAIYCPPLMQGALDLQSGILHAEEKDYKTGYSYFFETLENFAQLEDLRAMRALKYMLLCKIMLNLAEDVPGILNGKVAQKYVGSDIDAMKAVANAAQHRSLSEFEQTMAKFPAELTQDAIIRAHLAELYDTLLKQNLLRIIEPFSRVEIGHVASLIKLPAAQVEAKLSQMILDKEFTGILDQGAGCLNVYDKSVEDKTYEATLETIKNMGLVVDNLYVKAASLSA